MHINKIVYAGIMPINKNIPPASISPNGKGAKNSDIVGM
jgi:hypothetical protein